MKGFLGHIRECKSVSLGCINGTKLSWYMDFIAKVRNPVGEVPISFDMNYFKGLLEFEYDRYGWKRDEDGRYKK